MDEYIYCFIIDDVKVFFFFFICVNVRKIFDKVNDKYMLIVNKVCEVRDYLIIMISLKIGICFGVLENLKL